MLAHRIAQRYLRSMNEDSLRVEIHSTFDGIQEPLKLAVLQLAPSLLPKGVAPMVEEALSKIQEVQAKMTASAKQVTKSVVSHLKEVEKQLKPHVHQLRTYTFSPLSKLPERAVELVRVLEAQKIRTVDEWNTWGDAFYRAVSFQEQLQVLGDSREVMAMAQHGHSGLVGLIKTLGSDQKTQLLYGYWRTLRQDRFPQDAEDLLVDAVNTLVRAMSQLSGKLRSSLEISKGLIEMALKNLA